MMIPIVISAFFLFSLFAFPGTQARTLPDQVHDEKFNIKSITNYGRTSSPPPPSPTSSPPTKEVSSSSSSAGSTPGHLEVTVMRTSYDQETTMTSYGRTTTSPPPPPKPSSPAGQSQKTSSFCAGGSSYRKFKTMVTDYERPRRSPPPSPKPSSPTHPIAINDGPPSATGQITSTFCATGSMCNKFITMVTNYGRTASSPPPPPTSSAPTHPIATTNYGRTASSPPPPPKSSAPTHPIATTNGPPSSTAQITSTFCATGKECNKFIAMVTNYERTASSPPPPPSSSTPTRPVATTDGLGLSEESPPNPYLAST